MRCNDKQTFLYNISKQALDLPFFCLPVTDTGSVLPSSVVNVSVESGSVIKVAVATASVVADTVVALSPSVLLLLLSVVQAGSSVVVMPGDVVWEGMSTGDADGGCENVVFSGSRMVPNVVVSKGRMGSKSSGTL
jgi:hypothetical protein